MLSGLVQPEMADVKEDSTLIKAAETQMGPVTDLHIPGVNRFQAVQTPTLQRTATGNNLTSKLQLRLDTLYPE